MFPSRWHLLDRLGRLPGGGFWVFGLTQAWAALFGELMLVAVIVTHYVSLPGLGRYDWLFLFALAIQAFMLLAKLEKPHEVITIVAFHLVGLGMELFKTSHAIQSWNYPEAGSIKLGNVPLFSGFMYAAVGSYIARSWRIMYLQFSHYPKRFYTVFLALGIYINFFSHHFIYDFRYVLFTAFVLLYWRVWVSYSINGKVRRMPLLLAFVLIAIFIWLGENIGTFTHTWLYPNQAAHWQVVSVEKVGSWLLLAIISFIMVDLLHYSRSRLAKRRPEQTIV